MNQITNFSLISEKSNYIPYRPPLEIYKNHLHTIAPTQEESKQASKQYSSAAMMKSDTNRPRRLQQRPNLYLDLRV